MSKNMKRRLKDLKGLNPGGPLIARYPPDGGRAQIRVGKQSLAKRLTSNSKPSEEER